MTFNPKKWFAGGRTREDFLAELQAFDEGRLLPGSWSIQTFSKANVGDKCLFMVVGEKIKGIYGCGTIIGREQVDKDWFLTRQGKPVHYVPIDIEGYTDYQTPFFLLEQLKSLDSEYDWTPHNSGRLMPPAVAKVLYQQIPKKH